MSVDFVPVLQVLCEKYWPLERGTVHHGLIQVTTLERKRGPDYFVTAINLRQVRRRLIHHRRAPRQPGRAIDHRLKALHRRCCCCSSSQRHCATGRTITHYYYPSWPDRGVPHDPSSLCFLAEHIRKDLEAGPRLGPAVVHCRSDT